MCSLIKKMLGDTFLVYLDRDTQAVFLALAFMQSC